MVLDSQGYIFGAFVAESWKLDKHYFGNGETFLFRMHPSFEVYGWSRNNTYFVLGSNDCVAFASKVGWAMCCLYQVVSKDRDSPKRKKQKIFKTSPTPTPGIFGLSSYNTLEWYRI